MFCVCVCVCATRTADSANQCARLERTTISRCETYPVLVQYYAIDGMAALPIGHPAPHSSLPGIPAHSRRPSSDRQMESKKKEIYKYLAPWTVYAVNWSIRHDKRFRIAIGSFIEDYRNKVQVIQLDEDRGEFVLKAAFEHPYPPTKIMWVPDQVSQ